VFLAAGATVVRAPLVPLARGAIDNGARVGGGALPGPTARGDEQTVSRQRDAVASYAPESLTLWDALVTGTRAIAADLPSPADVRAPSGGVAS
jgi:predicted short-subunit dehydrogenase-like oxidoreductase (DUF2520 family)